MVSHLDILIDLYKQTTTINKEQVNEVLKVSLSRKFIWQGEPYKVLSLVKNGSWQITAEAIPLADYMKQVRLTRAAERKTAPVEDLTPHLAYCSGCLKLTDEGNCIAFKELWTQWKPADTECWSREEDPSVLLNALDDIEEYYNKGYVTQTPNGWGKEVQLLRPKLEYMVEKQIGDEEDEEL